MIYKLFIFYISLFTLSLANATISKPSTALTIIDETNKISKEYTFEEITKMQSVEFKDLIVTSKKGNHILNSAEGVLLKNLLTASGVDSSLNEKNKRVVIVASAIDGYIAVFSWHEVFNTPSSNRIFLAYKINAQLINKNEKNLTLMSPDDIFTGPRHVKWFNKITIKHL